MSSASTTRRSASTGEYDAVVACDWEAAYAAHRYPGRAKRFIFAQDFEPAFFPWGSDYAAAENSYRLGFHGFWPAHGSPRSCATSTPCPATTTTTRSTPAVYSYVNTKPRNEVLFYARPPTPRRATEFGLLALSELPPALARMSRSTWSVGTCPASTCRSPTSTTPPSTSPSSTRSTTAARQPGSSSPSRTCRCCRSRSWARAWYRW